MGFKVGDKVKTIKQFFITSKADTVGTIIERYPNDKEIPYKIAIGKGWRCPVYEKEIEPVLRVGQQLLLFEL